MQNVLPLLALQQIRGFGKKTINDILTEFPVFIPDSPEELSNLLGRLQAKIKLPGIDEIRSAWKYSEKIITTSEKDKILIISKEDRRYPRLLLKISDPPLLLHVKGNVDALNKDTIAIVGTRIPTAFSIEITREIGERLANSGYSIVSGLAEGIDKEAHESALNVGGITVAILAHGLDDVFPRRHRALAERILESNGALVSEYPIWAKVNKGYFIDRDRIQSGLSLAVFVVETGVDGGTMHTATFCNKQGRILFVLKPPEDMQKESKFQGNKKLLSENAIPFTKESCFEEIEAKLEDIRKSITDPIV